MSRSGKCSPRGHAYARTAAASSSDAASGCSASKVSRSGAKSFTSRGSRKSRASTSVSVVNAVRRMFSSTSLSHSGSARKNERNAVFASVNSGWPNAPCSHSGHATGSTSDVSAGKS